MKFEVYKEDSNTFEDIYVEFVQVGNSDVIVREVRNGRDNN